MDSQKMQSRQAYVELIECPRDAMQGWKTFIPTEKKIEYINQLLKVGFDTIDFGSFVSASAIPQLADTKKVISKIQCTNSTTKLLAIVANVRGAEEASCYDEISYLGYPFSVSNIFQLRNTNSTTLSSLKTVEQIQNICIKSGKQPIIYISMGFGNPYGELFSEEIVFEWVHKLVELDIMILSLADTIGAALPEAIFSTLNHLITHFPDRLIGVHLHSNPSNWKEKVQAALRAGCRRFDGALLGFGGCPLAEDELVGNLDSTLMIEYFGELRILKQINQTALKDSITLAHEIFV